MSKEEPNRKAEKPFIGKSEEKLAEKEIEPVEEHVAYKSQKVVPK